MAEMLYIESGRLLNSSKATRSSTSEFLTYALCRFWTSSKKLGLAQVLVIGEELSLRVFEKSLCSRHEESLQIKNRLIGL
jgi:hypothetical protein